MKDVIIVNGVNDVRIALDVNGVKSVQIVNGVQTRRPYNDRCSYRR